MLSPHIKFKKKKKRDLELFSLPHFSHNFWRKIFFLLYTINWPGYIVWLPLLYEILGNISQIFWFFGLLGRRGRGKRTKTSQTKSSPKLKIKNYMSCVISQEQYSAWSWFLGHLCKMMISPDLFFIFSKFWFFGLLVG